MVLKKAIKEVREREAQNLLAKLYQHYALKPLMRAVWDLCSENFPVYLAEQFRKTGSKPLVLNRSIVIDKLPTLHLYNKKSENELNSIPNDEFISAVTNWLQGLSEEDLRKEAETILSHADICAAAKVIQYTTVTNRDSVFLPILASRSSYRIGRIKEVFHFFTDTRNNLSHTCPANLEKLEPLGYVAQADNLIDILRGFLPTPCLEIEAFDTCSEQLKERFAQPDLYLENIEKKNNLDIGSLSAKLLKQFAYSSLMDPSGTVLLYTKEAELAPFIDSIKFDKYDKSALQETKVTPDTELTFSEADASLAFPLLSKYTASKFKQEQLRELVRNFALFADIGTWLSEQGKKVIADVIIPVLHQEKRPLHVEWGTLVNIYRLINEGETAEIRENARVAKSQMFDMHSRGWIRYVGSKNCHSDPNRSLMQFLHKNANVPTCVITSDSLLAGELQQATLPLCCCTKLWLNRGLAPYSDFDSRLVLVTQELTRIRTENETKAEEKPPVALADTKQLQKLKPETEPTQPAKELAGEPAIGQTDLIVSKYTVIPSVGSTVITESGEAVKLTKAKGEPGGEGIVYYTSKTGVLAKIYHPERITLERYEKLKAMRKIELRIPNICWPVSILANERHQFVGFLMPAAPEEALEISTSVFKLNGESTRKYLMPGWDRGSLVSCCIAVADTFAKLHNTGILMGDVNPRNIMVAKNDPSAVYFVDCDSYQVGKYPCTVGMAEYSSPEVLNDAATASGGYASRPRTIEDEQFSLATVLFLILMFGMSPFAKRGEENIADAVRGYRFHFKNGDDPGYKAPPGPYPLIWSNTAKWIKDMFSDVFLGKKTYPAYEWRNGLYSYLKAIESQKFTRELQPRKYPDFTGTQFADYICDGCGYEANMPIQQFQKERNKLKFCRQCNMRLERFRRMPQAINCDACGEAFDATRYDLFMQQRGKKQYCTSCRTLRCSNCMQTFLADPYLVEKKQGFGRFLVRCPSCQQKWKESRK